MMWVLIRSTWKRAKNKYKFGVILLLTVVFYFRHYPVGVLFDLLGNNESLPWHITVHFQVNIRIWKKKKIKFTTKRRKWMLSGKFMVIKASDMAHFFNWKVLGSVVQSIISLTSSLEVKMLTVLVSTISNSQVFLLKNVSSFCKCKSYSHFFSKILAYMPYLTIKVLTIC